MMKVYSCFSGSSLGVVGGFAPFLRDIIVVKGGEYDTFSVGESFLACCTTWSSR